MTEDYKKSLIDYVSGLLKIEAERPTDFDPNEIAGTGVEDYTSQRWSTILSAFDGKSISINLNMNIDLTAEGIKKKIYQKS